MSDIQRKSRAALLAACVLMLTASAGCGKEEEGLQIETIKEVQENAGDDSADDGNESIGNDVTDSAEKNAGDDVTDSAEKNAGDTDGGQDSAARSAGNAKLEGNVLSLSGDSFVAARIETWSEGDSSFAVGAAPGYEKEEDRITVHVTESCTYEYKTVKNGGINPEDISTREGSFADVKEGLAVIIKGSWQEDGSFLADSIVMEEFV